ncbi:class II aldolase/adducin family protein [Plastoroseomonas arctica]|uniref:Class II aldolase/adducin family protein n=1 Tax=Plastoroseomonas arctica TaxID=1509237 RepID=A0AAF1KNE5_9PROT|nr:class II aldolase/adducin family protein [Plastoroseomonas arctica]MBR0654448.1 class II aldolase/adducin family protein [Plastoroseomonas arctica]
MQAGTAIEAALQELGRANRILAHENVVDDFGHIALRDPEDPTWFWLSRARPPNLVTVEDFRRYDAEGRCEDPTVRSYSEAVLHAGVFALRPDVQVCIHHHARPLLPFTMPGAPPLRPVFHTGSIAGWDIPLWDSAPFGAGGMLVDTAEKAWSLAEALGPHRAALLRAHGAVVVGGSIAEAVMIAIYMAENAAVALSCGAPHRDVPTLSEAKAAETSRRLLNAETLARVWDGRVARLG